MAQHEAERVITLKLITIVQSVLLLILLQLSHDYETFFKEMTSYIWSNYIVTSGIVESLQNKLVHVIPSQASRFLSKLMRKKAACY